MRIIGGRRPSFVDLPICKSTWYESDISGRNYLRHGLLLFDSLSQILASRRLTFDTLWWLYLVVTSPLIITAWSLADRRSFRTSHLPIRDVVFHYLDRNCVNVISPSI
jgi:hypothetical protein